MRKIKHKKTFISLLFLILISLLLSFCFSHHSPFNVIISPKEHPVLQQNAQILAQKMQDTPLPVAIDFYMANFNDSHIPEIKNKQHTNIIWLGSHNNFDTNKLKNFTHILTSTLDLSTYLKNANIPNSVHPLFIDDKTAAPAPSACVLNPKLKDCYFVIIGHQPEVLSVIKQNQLNYKNFSAINDQLLENINQDISHISGIITNHTRFSEDSLDISPFYLKAINQQIPILSPNLYKDPQIKKLQNNLAFTLLFADTLSYYTYESDIEDFFSCTQCRLKNAKKAKYILNHIFSISALKTHIQTLLNNTPYEPHIKNTLTIISPTYAGIYNNGDYWIAKDLEDAFAPNYQETLTVFPMSQISYIGDTYLYIRGGIPLTENKIRPHTVSLYYLLFPSFADENNITNLDDFIQNIKNELKNVDAIAIASEKLASALKNKGFNTYYIPQFTNTEKFYPDYDNDKKSEVLFVGNYLSYRTAVPTTLAAGLPLTVYGSGWQKGIAKAPYIDNRILRKYYSSAKIVLNDTREGMKKFGFIINRIFDATACETLVISDYMPEIEKIYGDTVPMWKTEQELVDLIKYYLAPEHEAERKDKARRAREITLNNFTAEIVAKKFQDIITNIKQQKGL